MQTWVPAAALTAIEARRTRLISTAVCRLCTRKYKSVAVHYHQNTGTAWRQKNTVVGCQVWKTSLKCKCLMSVQDSSVLSFLRAGQVIEELQRRPPKQPRSVEITTSWRLARVSLHGRDSGAKWTRRLEYLHACADRHDGAVRRTVCHSSGRLDVCSASRLLRLQRHSLLFRRELTSIVNRTKYWLDTKSKIPCSQLCRDRQWLNASLQPA